MESSSSDNSGSEDMSESPMLSNTRKSNRTGLSRGERSKRPLKESDDSDDAERIELTSSNWQSNLSATPAIGLPNIESGSASRMSFEFEDDDSDMEDQDEDGSILDGPFGLGNSNFCWPPPGVENVIQDDDRKLKGDKKRKPGIIYLSTIPIGYNVSRTTGFFSQYGRVGRVFLQPDLKEKSKRKDKLARNFTEGWIEFTSKRVAKDVAANLNLSQVGGKKRSKAHDVTWNIKYLPGFKWTNLSERLAYENAVHQQRMRTEISQAKRETDYFKANVERSKRANVDRESDSLDLALPFAKKSRKTVNLAVNNPGTKRTYEFRQKETDDTIKKRKRLNQGQKKFDTGNFDLDPQMSFKEKKNSPENKIKIKTSTKEHEKPNKLNMYSMSPKSAKGDDLKFQRSPSKVSNPKAVKNKSIKTATSNLMGSNKSNSIGSTTDTKKNGSKSKGRNVSGTRKKESQGNGDRTEFLKSVFL